MSVTIIAAVSENGVIGKENDLPWHLPEDMAHFKKKTTGTVVVMGRRTWESLPKSFRPLPNRVNVVLSRSPQTLPGGVEQYSSIEDALNVHRQDTVYVIGGAQVYAAARPYADALEITEVPLTIDGDAKFFPIDPNEFREVSREHGHTVQFVRFERIHPPS